MANVQHFDDGNFETEVLGSQVPVLVDFYADWCGPCRSLAPIIEELARDFTGQLKVGKLDVDQNRVPSRYGIMAIPTMILFKGGEERAKITGLRSKADLRKQIEAVIAG
jgi:thioredoxin 1